MARLLIIDDDATFNKTLARALAVLGHEVVQTFSLAEGKNASDGDFDVIFLDVRLPDGNGLEAIAPLSCSEQAPEVIIVTGEGDPDGAELAMRNGAWDYVEKPFTLDKISLSLKRALAYRSHKSAPPVQVLRRDGILGSSPELAGCLELLGRAAGMDVPVLLTGETGTGKELFARALHANSSRNEGPFVVVDCAAIPDTLIESQLFGYDKGAFTGAVQDRRGLAAQAHRGTLFLDEIAEMPLHQQKALLRLIQEKRFRPVGAGNEQSSDFRLVSATNKDLWELVRQGEFREDLLFRIEAFRIELPPLRKRAGDVRELAMARLDSLCSEHKLPTRGFSPCFLDALAAYGWPGNVRELLNAVDRAVFTAGQATILYARDLPDAVRVSAARAKVSPHSVEGEASPPAAPDILAGPELPPLHDFRERLERQYLETLLDRTRGNVSEASRLAGVSRQHLHKLLTRHGLGRHS